MAQREVQQTSLFVEILTLQIWVRIRIDTPPVWEACIPSFFLRDLRQKHDDTIEGAAGKPGWHWGGIGREGNEGLVTSTLTHT